MAVLGPVSGREPAPLASAARAWFAVGVESQAHSLWMAWACWFGPRRSAGQTVREPKQALSVFPCGAGGPAGSLGTAVVAHAERLPLTTPRPRCPPSLPDTGTAQPSPRGHTAGLLCCLCPCRKGNKAQVTENRVHSLSYLMVVGVVRIPAYPLACKCRTRCLWRL